MNIPLCILSLRSRGFEVELLTGADGEQKVRCVSPAKGERVPYWFVDLLRDRKPDLVDALRSLAFDALNVKRAAADNRASAEGQLRIDIETFHPDHCERLESLLQAATANRLPIERVTFDAKGGHSAPDPNLYVVKAVSRMRALQGYRGCRGGLAYLDATLNERTGLQAILAWWELRSAQSESASGNEAPASSPVGAERR